MLLIIEILVALFISVLATITGMELLQKNEQRREVYEGLKRAENFPDVLNEVFAKIVNHVRENCASGFQDSSCLQTLPYPSNLQNTSGGLGITYSLDSQMQGRNTLKEEISAVMEKINCRLSSDDGTLVEFFCPGISFSGTYTVPQNPLNPPAIAVEVKLYGNRTKTATVVWDEVERRRELNRKLLEEIAKVMRSYYRSRLLREIENACSPGGGLPEEDDKKIPWIMQAYTTNPYDACNTSTTTSCSCTNVNWDTVNQDTQQQTLMQNLGIYQSLDYFGMPLKVYAVVDQNDNPVNPPSPSSGYSSYPPYFGLVRLSETLPCVANKESHCYLKFVYPYP